MDCRAVHDGLLVSGLQIPYCMSADRGLEVFGLGGVGSDVLSLLDVLYFAYCIGIEGLSLVIQPAFGRGDNLLRLPGSAVSEYGQLSVLHHLDVAAVRADLVVTTPTVDVPGATSCQASAAHHGSESSC